MKFFSLFTAVLFPCIVFSQQATDSLPVSEFQVIPGASSTQVLGNLNENDSKVTISNGSNSLEIYPQSSILNGAMIQSVNRLDNTGVPTSFYIQDTASWTFYTNGLERLKIGGSSNNIVASSPLLINSNSNGSDYALRVNGNTKIDSGITIKGVSDNSYVSLNRNVQYFNQAFDDSISPFTITPTAWVSPDVNLPVFRLRHPMNVSGSTFPNISIQRDFTIHPYEFGMAIEYNGVVECWVGEWSIHRGLAYKDVETKGNGWGAVLWIGDDHDNGGVRATARNNIQLGGQVNYGEISVEKFAGTPNGDFRLRLPSTDNQFHFVYGERGSTNIIAKMKNNGLVIPIVPSVTATPAPEKAQIVFDSTAGEFKGYTGTQWNSLGANAALVTGSFQASANGANTVYAIPHQLAATPSYFTAIATSPDAANIKYITADANNIYINYAPAPLTGTNNLSWNWQAKL